MHNFLVGFRKLILVTLKLGRIFIILFYIYIVHSNLKRAVDFFFFFFSIAIYTLTPDLVIKSAVFWSISTGPYSLSSRLQAVDQVSFLTDWWSLHSCRTCSVVWSPSPHLHLGDPTILSLWSCLLSLLWLVLRRKMITWSCLVSWW